MANEDDLDSSSSSSEEDNSESEYDSSEASDYEDFQENLNENEGEDSPEKNLKLFTEVLDSRIWREKYKREKDPITDEERFNFPIDPENWREEDNGELWADAPTAMKKPGWDPVWADEEDWDVVKQEAKAGRDLPIAPFYLPYRKFYPAIPNNHVDIANPKAVIEELDRIEEFLKWLSFVFADGSSYEGTVWDDLAHGKGVYVAENGLVRYEGEWLQNNMEGHGVVEVDIPGREPVPGSKLEAKMRAEGKIISRDFMSPEDREWLEMDIEDSYHLANGKYEIPFDENKLWTKIFGKKPEKGRYRYAGQWKHGRMHGCGVYEVNEQPIYGRFYFGELADDSTGCDENISAMHAGIAEVAAAKARMFINKPDGMVREERGPYTDPQHPYLYEEEDVWMAPGFIHQFYDVPDYWKTYAKEVDEEREMWLNSFYKAPLRIPMPAELEHWWSKDDSPEFVLLNKEPEPDPEDPSKLVYTEDPIILHTRTGRFINFVDDEKHGVRLFWQPPLKEGEDVDPEKAQFLPLGFDEFYGRATAKKEGTWKRLVTKLENVWNPVFNKLENWAEETKKESEMKLKLIEQELELVEAELCLEEAIEDMDTELKKKEKEEDKQMEMDQQVEKEDTSKSVKQDEIVSDDEDDEDDDDDDDDNDDGPSSFGSAVGDQNPAKNDKKGNKPGKSPFSTSSLSFASFSMVSTVPSQLHESFLSWKKNTRKSPGTVTQSPQSFPGNFVESLETSNSVSFPQICRQHSNLKAAIQEPQRLRNRNSGLSQLHSLSRILYGTQASSRHKRTLDEQMPSHLHHSQPETDWSSIFFLPIPDNCLGSCTNYNF